MRFKTPRGVCGVVCASMLAVASAASDADGATIPVAAGGDLQAAIDAAQGGDVITLEPGATYVGNFVLWNKSGITEPIVIRSAAPDSALPGRGIRMTPAYAALLPKIKSPSSMPAMRTATGAHHWTLMFLEFQANQNGYGDIIALGAGDSTQIDLAQVPYSLLLDRLYVHGDPQLGQKRGISLNSRDTTIINSYVSDCKAVGQDTQAISGFNGPGNYLIENNYLEGAGENFMLGGADPTILNLVPTNIVFRRNHLYKPLEWRNPIIAGVTSVAAQPVAGGGSLAAGTYAYKVVARRAAGQTNKAVSEASVEVSATVAAGDAVTISWLPVAGADEYLVYGRTSGALSTYWQTTAPFFTDTGAAGTSGTPAKATKWVVKNLFELKSAQDIVIEGNVFENLWIAAQSGYAIALTPRNQDGRAPWTVLQRVMFRNNLVRHTAGGVNILGRDNLHPSLQTNNITVQNNLFDDMTAATWGSGSRFLIIGDGPDAIAIDHNTVITTNSGIVWLYGGASTSPTPITNMRYTNNMSAHNRYGIMGQGYLSGLPTITAYLPGGVVTNNALAGGSASAYPAGNFFPTTLDWQNGFVNFAAGDYRLSAASPLKNAATDGTDLGADVEKVRAETLGALTGDNSVPPGTTRVQIVTSSLPNAALNQPYAETLTCAGGSGTCQWVLREGVLQDGLTFDPVAGVIAGAPTVVDERTLAFEAFDAAWPDNFAVKPLTLAVDPPALTVVMPALPAGQVGVPYDAAATVTGALGSVSWTVPSGSLPAGTWLDAVSGIIGGVPSAWGTSTFVVQARDSWGTDRVAEAAATITVAPAPLWVASGSLPSGAYGAAYAAALTATGGTGSTTWALTAGLLPAGLAVDVTGSVTGTPSEAGTFTFTARATDVNWPSYTADGTFSLTVAPPSIVAPPPPPPPPTPQSEAPALDVVLHASGATTIAGTWQRVADPTAASGYRVWNPDAAAAKLAAPLGEPANYIELTFSAEANVPYHLWVRGKADKNYWSNDSVFVQFSDAVNAAGAPLDRIGTTSATVVTIEDGTSAGLAGWGWADNAFGRLADPIVFAVSGPQKMRIQVREDGLSLDQIVLSPSTYAITPPGATKNDTTLLPSTEVVLYTAHATAVFGTWSQVADATAAGGFRLWNANLGAAKLAAPLATPANYFELTFEAAAGVPYHLWVRGKADQNSWANDSIYVQFSQAIDASGAAIYGIGTTSAATVTIEDGTNAGLSGWGWQDNSFGALAKPIVFGASGTQTIRIQVREDGLSVDQIVLSTAMYATAAPGATKNDATILIK